MKRSPHFSTFLIVLAALSLLTTLAVVARQRGYDPKPPISTQAKNAGRQAIASVGLILVRNGGDASEPRPRGSAVVVSRDGMIATNCHVITQDKSNNIFDDIYIALANAEATVETANRYRVKIIALNRSQDLALLRIVADIGNRPLPQATGFPALPLADVRSLKLLDDLIIIGFPRSGGLSATVNIGVVEGRDEANHWIKTDARFIHGNSGGAAVNAKGELVGIPTKVIVDTRRVDKDGDGFPDEEVPLGAVGFLRPAYLIKKMIEQSRNTGTASAKIIPIPPLHASAGETDIILRGMVKSATTGKPLAGVRVGLVPLGVRDVKADNLLSWGGTNAEGKFVMNKSVTPGRYLFKAKAFAHEALSKEIDVKAGATEITIELRPEARSQ